MSSLKSLFTPLKIGNTEIKNRFGMSALTRNRAQATYPTELMKEYYLQRVRGGVGLVVSEGTLITRQGTEWPHAPGIWDEKHIKGWKNITDAVHEAGGKMYLQLWHVGRASHPEAPEQKLAGVPVYAPSAISARGGQFRFLPGDPGYVTPTAIDDPWKLVALYKQGALNAKEAGFDGVELHAANGYLVTQFLDTSTNDRTDEWGGSVENRARFGLEVLKAMVEVFGRDVSMRVSPAGGYNDVGMPLKETLETFGYFLSEADKLDLAYITLIRYSKFFDPSYPGTPNRATNFDVLAALRPSIKNAKVFLNAGVTAEEAAALIEQGQIDGVMNGMLWISHPDYAKRVLYGKPLDNEIDFALSQRGSNDEDWFTGYTSYPAATYAADEVL